MTIFLLIGAYLIDWRGGIIAAYLVDSLLGLRALWILDYRFLSFPFPFGCGSADVLWGGFAFLDFRCGGHGFR